MASNAGDLHGTPIRRRQALVLTASGLAVTILPACVASQPAASAQPTTGPGGTATSQTSSTPIGVGTLGSTPAASSGASAQPKTGGTLRFGTAADIANLGFGSISFEVLQGLYDPVLAYDDKLQPVPSLAESWELSTDFTQIKLNLRQGVQFHTGRELTSDDIAYNLERTKDPTRSYTIQSVGLAKAWTSQTPDKYTVILSSDKPRIGVFDFLTQLWIADKETLQGPDAANKAVGTGPFTLVEWIQGDHASFARNTNYWRSGRPYLDGYQVAITKDPQAMMVRLEAGALDFVNYPQTSDALRLTGDAKYQVLPAFDLGFIYAIWINLAAPPFDKKEVRQAMNYALDRQRFVDTTLGGLVGPPRDLPWPPHSPAAEPAKNAIYTFDLDKASSLLESAGVSNFTAELNYVTAGPIQEFTQLAQIYQGDLAKIGVNVNIQPMDNGTWSDTAVKAAYKGMAIGMPSGFGGQDATSGLQTGAFGAANAFSNFKDDTYTQLVQSAGSETDASKRQQLYSQINDIILDQSFTMPVSSFLAVSVATARVHGVTRTRTGVGGPILTDAWME
ncbi:MAG: ABC transporter substrate-binding protein [Chloroflexi bacterium]|nr:ABC transporter substrate-binding protein [Chloroflexota bacterium]